MSKREFVQDKVYLQREDGSIWEYEPLLAKVKGVKRVIPNPSKREAAQQKQEQKQEQKQQTPNQQTATKQSNSDNK